MLKTARIVFEDEQILVVDKPAGVVVNRAGTIKEETVQDWLAENFQFSIFNFQNSRHGIVHRLDRETSGLLLVAKTQKAFDFLQKEFRERQVKKEYIALVHGKVKEREGSIEAKIGRIGKFGKFGVIKERYHNVRVSGWGVDGRRITITSDRGKESKTDYKKVSSFQFPVSSLEKMVGQFTKSRVSYLKHHAVDYTLLNVFPKTGRTHQIRVHLKSIGHPVVSDLIYAPGKLLKFDLMWCPRLFLHASKLVFSHPKSRKKVQFSSDLPNDLKQALSFLTLLR
ncbi:RluA family pseudouridine synthase [Candidatus Curtissbacteria bacterium]|nr:RluA family pseudouridine synthase [Candidatus Curtissbacteria bacterium]